MSRSTLRSSIPVVSFVACILLALPALADSHVRMVRLSDVKGSVQIDKNSGAGFENAFINLPVTEGTQIRTGDDGRAEIEFEDGGTMRLAPNTTVQFSTLANESDVHVSAVNLVDGMAYVNWTAKLDHFTLKFSREKVELNHPAHFRVETSPTEATFGVFKGDVEVAGPSSSVTVSKKKMVTFATSDNDKATEAENLQEDALDTWDKEAVSYHTQYSKTNTSPYGYGASDLGYYGNFTNVSGYGMMWQPYFTGVGWDPFMDGAWSFYPGAGYTFVSAYPWGWMPYRYGNWMFIPGFGWMWQPGNWNTFAYVPRYSGVVPARFRVPVAPAAGGVRTVAVGRGGVGTAAPPSRVVLRQGSAGLGVTRGSVSSLKSLNSQVAKSGSVVLHPTPEFGRTSVSRATGGGSTASPAGAARSTASRPSMGSSSSGASRASAPVHSAPSSSAHAPAPSPHR